MTDVRTKIRTKHRALDLFFSAGRRTTKLDEPMARKETSDASQNASQGRHYRSSVVRTGETN
jgi:hypothetical protein